MLVVCDFTASNLKGCFTTSTIFVLMYGRLDVSFLFFIAVTSDDITVLGIQRLVHNHTQAHRILTFYIQRCVKPTLVHGAYLKNLFQLFSMYISCFIPFFEMKRIIFLCFMCLLKMQRTELKDFCETFNILSVKRVLKHHLESSSSEICLRYSLHRLINPWKYITYVVYL